MPVPTFPHVPEDDPVASLRLTRDYLRDLVVYFSPIKIAVAFLAFTILACTVVYWTLGFNSMLSWASDFVPLLFAVVGIVVSVRKFRDEHQAAVISVIVIVGILGTVVLHLSRIHDENSHAAEIRGLRERMDSWQQQNTELLSSLLKPVPLNAQASEIDRRQNIEKALRGEYILSHDNVSPEVLAGTQFPPADWMNRRLRELGESWTVTASKTTTDTSHTARSYVVFDGTLHFAERKDDKGQLLPDQNFQVGDKIFFNYGIRATGPNPIELKGFARWLYLEPDFGPGTQRQIVADFKRRLNEERKQTTIEPGTLMPGDHRWDSAIAFDENKQFRLVTRTDLDAFRAGTEIAFVLAEVSYLDNGKLHYLRTCQFLQPPAIAPGVWHYCDGFNQSE
jgi:hypothetical protein